MVVTTITEGIGFVGLSMVADALFLGPLTPIIRFLLPLLVLLVVVYVLYKVIS